MKIIKQGKEIDRNWYAGRQHYCGDCGLHVELEAGDEGLARVTAFNHVKRYICWNCKNCGSSQSMTIFDPHDVHRRK